MHSTLYSLGYMQKNRFIVLKTLSEVNSSVRANLRDFHHPQWLQSVHGCGQSTVCLIKPALHIPKILNKKTTLIRLQGELSD